MVPIRPPSFTAVSGQSAYSIMMHSSHPRLLGVGLLTLALGACASGAAGAGRAPAPEPIPDVLSIGPSSPSAIAAARADSARHPYVEADVRFMTGMIGHHAQAIVMSRLAPTHGASPAILRLASRIINAQLDEISTMQLWLADRQQPVPVARLTLTPAADAHDEHADHALMTGMLTATQLRELDAARGPGFDRLFLRYMIQHHRGATAMVAALFGSYGAGQDEGVFRFATDVNVDQLTEIARMELLLESLALPTPPQRTP